MYEDGQAAMDVLRSSGFTTVILWSIHRIVSGGQYVGDTGWPGRLRTLKQAPTSVDRIEVSVGAWSTPDWQAIDNLITRDGTGSDTILYRNFLALRNATGADAINNDDESHYERMYLQAYAGGTGNNPGSWAQSLGMPVDPGLWSKHGSGRTAGHSPAEVESQMRSWRASAGIPGGFMWLYDDIKLCSASGTAADYARAINNATG